jgi:hypothetical protein
LPTLHLSTPVSKYATPVLVVYASNATTTFIPNPAPHQSPYSHLNTVDDIVDRYTRVAAEVNAPS